MGFFPTLVPEDQKNTCINTNVLRVIRARDRAHKIALSSGFPEARDSYKLLRNQVTNMNRKARTNYLSSHLQKNATNPKAFWNILRNVLPGKDKGRYIQNLVEDGKDLHDQEAIAESLNQYFTTIASSLLHVRTIVRNNQTKKPPALTCSMCHICVGRAFLR